ncbi:MAG: nitroreductase family protein, partial [Muribaculaceae bacterium]
SPDDVKLIMEAALMAPSSKRTTPWQFLLIEDKAKLEILSHCKDFGASPIANCSLAIIVMVNPAISEAWIEDAAIAATLIQLQAEDLGLGSCWIQVHGRFTKEGQPAEEFIEENLNVPNELSVLCVITLGHKDEERKPFNPEKLQWEKVHIGEWKE